MPQTTSTFSLLRKAPCNPATRPELTQALRAQVAELRERALVLLQEVAGQYKAQATFSSSLGAEDMVLTDIILREKLDVEIFTLDTGRLPPQTYELMGKVEQHYGTRLKVYFPDAQEVEQYVQAHGINAFYDSVELRKACCQLRKVRPLARALAGKKAWITGLRAAQSLTRADLALRSTDAERGLEKISPLAQWSDAQVWAYIRLFDVPYNALHEAFYPSIGCAPCSRAIAVGEDIRAGRWWWENEASKECGLHPKE